MSTPASPPLEVMALGLAVPDGVCVWVVQHANVPDARPDICTARPLPSCSRPDGQCLRHWDREPWWTNTGIDCEAGPS